MSATKHIVAAVTRAVNIGYAPDEANAIWTAQYLYALGAQQGDLYGGPGNKYRAAYWPETLASRARNSVNA